MGKIELSKRNLSLLIFIMLFSFTDILTFISTSSLVLVIAIFMLLVPTVYMVYQINCNEDELPKIVGLICLVTSVLYIFFNLFNLIIYAVSFFASEKELYLIWDYKLIIFGSILLLIFILNRIRGGYAWIKYLIALLGYTTVLVIVYLMFNFALGHELSINLVSYDSAYTNLITLSIPLLFLVLRKYDNRLLLESLESSLVWYIMVAIVVMILSNFTTYTSSVVTYFNTAFTSMLSENLEPFLATVIIIIYLVSLLFKLGLVYTFAKRYYDEIHQTKSNYSLSISYLVAFIILLMIHLWAIDLWTMMDVINSMYTVFGIILLLLISFCSIYMCFRKYIVSTSKATLLVLSTFPMILCIAYIYYIDSPLLLVLSDFISNVNIVFFGFSLFILIFYTVETVILLYAYKHRIYTADLEQENVDEAIDIFVMIPCMNEDLVINQTITSLLNNDYPNLHLYVIDDGSSDNTASEVTRCVDPRNHLLSRVKPEAQQGKGEALNWAYYQLIGQVDEMQLDHDKVLITIIDADTEVEPDYFAKVNKVFQNMPEVTGLQSKVRVIELGADSAQDLEFTAIINSAQSLRNLTDTVAFGGNGQFCRLSTLEKLDEKPWSKSLVEDFDLSTRLYLACGDEIHNIQFDDIYIKQSGIVNDAQALVKQRVRWAQGNVQSFKYIKQIIGSNKLRFKQKIELSMTLIKPWLMAIEYAILMYTLVLIADVLLIEGLNRAIILVIVLFLIMGLYIIIINLIWSTLYNFEKPEKLRIRTVISDTYYLTKFLFTLTQIYPQSIIRHLKSDNGWDKTKRQKKEE